ncbi:hypothetical protein AVEN_159161-1 [Araneus ventricosus]|uniref:Uncharacterized protein n=1 Tax=Araneus ventricosus TaxID=182803 RepID=A0A4Y2LFR1_ARAVE|nr:hypothetical protein AVEN_159161-1 [Araneus ventricosus]
MLATNQHCLGVYSGTPGWVGRRHFFRTLTTGKVPPPNPTGGTRIDPLVSRGSGGLAVLEFGPKGSGFKTRFYRRSTVDVDLVHIKFGVGRRPVTAMMRKFNLAPFILTCIELSHF